MLEALVLYAVIGNRLTEVFKRVFVDKYSLPSWVTLIASLVIGVALAFAQSVNWFGAQTAAVNAPAWVGIVLSGIAIGAASNVTNSLAELVSAWADAKKDLPPASTVDPMAAARIEAARVAASMRDAA